MDLSIRRTAQNAVMSLVGEKDGAVGGDSQPSLLIGVGQGGKGSQCAIRLAAEERHVAPVAGVEDVEGTRGADSQSQMTVQIVGRRNVIGDIPIGSGVPVLGIAGE